MKLVESLLDFKQEPSKMSRDKQAQAACRFFTIAEMAEDLKVSIRTVRRWITAGELVVHRLGSVVRIAASDRRAFLERHRED